MTKVVIAHGYVPPDAAQDEQDVLVEAAAVANALSELGYKPLTMPLFFDTQKMIADIQAVQPAFIFNLVESIQGKGRFIYLAPTIYDYLKIPYTGAPTDAIYVTSNKLLAKRVLTSANIFTPPWLTSSMIDQGEIPLEPPYIVKALWEHASIGLSETSIIGDKKQLKKMMQQQIQTTGEIWFAEKYIDGREFNLSIIGGSDGPRVLPPAEIVFQDFPAGKPRIVDYRAKWEETSYEYQHTIRTFDFPENDNSLLEKLSELAIRCWRLFELRGYARVDFRVDEQQTPYILEVNVNPCLSPDAGFYAACQRGGLSYAQVIRRIVEDSQ